LIKYILDELHSIYNYAISKNYAFYNFDFKLLWSECFEAANSNDTDIFILFYSFFTYILDKIFGREYKKEKQNESMIYNLFVRILQIKELYSEKFCKEIILEKYNILLNKYEKLIDYEKLKPNFQRISDTDYLKIFQIS
jgi:hypothetical protein